MLVIFDPLQKNVPNQIRAVFVIILTYRRSDATIKMV
jgi:hypothetical protein